MTYLESVVHADEVLGLLLHVVPERALDLLVDAEDEREVDEGPQVEHAGLVAEEELLLAEQVAEDVEVLLAHGLDLLVGVAVEAGRLQLPDGLAEVGVLDDEGEDVVGHLAVQHLLQVQLVALDRVRHVAGLPGDETPENENEAIVIQNSNTEERVINFTLTEGHNGAMIW